jgi:hypothetical protein
MSDPYGYGHYDDNSTSLLNPSYLQMANASGGGGSKDRKREYEDGKLNNFQGLSCVILNLLFFVWT